MITKYLVFDFGGTLADYVGMPKAWNDYYPEAFELVSKKYGVPFTTENLEKACQILVQYNPRFNPRINEISDEVIFQEVNEALGICEIAGVTPKEVARTFYSFFQQKFIVYEDTRLALGQLKKQGCKIGVLSDLPTAMPHESFIEDISKIGFDFDTIQSSQSTGWRKPCSIGIELIADMFGCKKEEITFIGDEKKDMDTIDAAGGIGVFINRKRKDVHFGDKLEIYSINELLSYFEK